MLEHAMSGYRAEYDERDRGWKIYDSESRWIEWISWLEGAVNRVVSLLDNRDTLLRELEKLHRELRELKAVIARYKMAEKNGPSWHID